LSDSIPLTDQITTQKTFVRTLSDSIPLTDQITTGPHVLSRSFVEQISLSDTVAPNLAANQQLIENAQTQVTVDPVKTDLVITSSAAALSTVTVPSTVTNPTLNYTMISHTSGSTNTVTIDNGLTITKDTSGDNSPEVQVTIPAGITISGPTSWRSVINLPNVIANPIVPTESNTVNTVTQSIEIGFGSTSLTFDKAVRMVFVGKAGQRVGFFNSNTPFTEITATCTDNTQSTNNGLPSNGACKITPSGSPDLIVWTKHFTGFGTFSSSSTSSGSTGSTGTSSGSTGGAGGAVGVGPSGTGTGSEGFGGILTPNLKIYEVSYNVCTSDTVKITIGTDPEAHPTVILRTMSGIIQAQLSKDQPFTEQNVNATIQKTVYVAHIDPKETSFEVVVLEAMGKNINTVGKTIEINGCSETISVENGAPVTQPTQIDLSTPKIFDVKFQIGNDTKVLSSDVTNQYIKSQSITVYSIIDSPTPLDRAELRFVKLGDDITKYIAVHMDVSPLQISNTTYIISGVIPKEMAQAPAITYWIHVQNQAGKSSDSDQYFIGVKPSYSSQAKLEVDILLVRAEGTTAKPIAYFTNTGNPVFGTISLVVDNNTVYTSPSQLFGAGQTAVNLKWKTPILGYVTGHQVFAKYNGYDDSIDTSTVTVTTFPETKTLSISQPVNIGVIEQNNNTIAVPLILHSSFKYEEGDLRYQVTAPDGTCVIGPSDNCLVTKSTIGQSNFKSVTIGDQIYRVRYAGSESTLERFTITSVDPIVGDWKVEIVSQNGFVPSAHATHDIFLQVKYKAVETSFVKETSK